MGRCAQALRAPASSGTLAEAFASSMLVFHLAELHALCTSFKVQCFGLILPGLHQVLSSLPSDGSLNVRQACVEQLRKPMQTTRTNPAAKLSTWGSHASGDNGIVLWKVEPAGL